MGANVVQVDIKAKNGIIHVIDRVIMPSTLDIVETAVKAGSFKTLATALQAASLVETLQGKGPFTVFAPTDAAFAKLPEGTVASVVQPENLAKLKAILTYHVVPGRVFRTDLKNGMKATTAQGASLAIKIGKEGVHVNGSKVVQANIDAANGVIHVIDAALMPPVDETADASQTARDGRRLIEMAIHRGARMYNDGDARGCVAVYEVAAHGLMSLCADDFCPSSRKKMARSLERASHVHDMDRRAWMLRHRLDRAMVVLSN